MTITVSTPDGGTAEFPDGTDKDTITSAMKSKFGGPSDSGVGDTWTGYAGNLAYRAANTGTLGLADLGLAGLHAAERATGYDPNATDLETIRKQDEEFGSKYPIASTLADITGYGVGFGKLGLAARGARALEGLGAGARVAQAGGTAGEAVAADIGSHATRGELPSAGDVATDVTVGGALGGLIGGRGRALGPAIERASSKLTTEGIGAAKSDLLGPEVAAPKPRSVVDLTADEASAWKTLESNPVKPATVSNTIKNSLSSLTPGQQAQMSDRLSSQIDQIQDIVSNSPKLSMGDVESFQRAIGKAAQFGNPGDDAASGKVGDALRSLTGQAGDDARMAFARLKTVQKLTDPAMDPSAAVKYAQGEINNPRRLFDPYGREAMQNLAALGPKPGAFSDLARNIGGALTDKYAAGYAGHVIGGMLGHGLVGAPAAMVANEIAKAGITAAKNASAKRALKAAIASVSTGARVSPADYKMAPWASQTAREAFYASRANQD